MELTNNERAIRRLNAHAADLNCWDVRTQTLECGTQLYDFGARHLGTIGGGLLLARTCMSDLADVSLTHQFLGRRQWPMIQVSSDRPVQACLASQYAGWPVTGRNYFAMGSGPARLLRGREPMLESLQLKERSPSGILILESSRMPDETVAMSVAAECSLNPSEMSIAIARTASLSGLIQIVARSLETTLHKMHEVGFDVRCIHSGIGFAPLPPIPPDDLTAIGWSNDAILYGAAVHIIVNCEDDQIENLRSRLTSDTADDFGIPFLKIFEKYDRDFYKIDKLLFSPAQVTINNARTGKTIALGRVHERILAESFGIDF